MSKYFKFNPKQEKFVPGETRISYGGAMIGQEEIDAILDVVTSQGGKRWTVGPESIAFEQELAEWAQVDYSVVTNSGSSGLLLALAALELKPGSSIMVPATTFPTAYNAIVQNRLRPAVVDTVPDTFLIDLNEVEQLLKEYVEKKYPLPQAIIAVNIAGNAVDMDRLMSIRDKYGIYIILDNCDGLGTKWKGKPIDSYADISVASFHAAHIITTGEGGAVMTNNKRFAEVARKMREWGRADGTDEPYNYPGLPKGYPSRYVYEHIGYNIKPLELQCAMGRVQLRKIEDFVSKRRQNYDKLKKLFESIRPDNAINFAPSLTVVKESENAESCWFGFPFLCANQAERKSLTAFLEKRQIETRTIFAGNILRHPAYRNHQIYRSGTTDGADEVMKRGVFISNHPSLTDEQIEYIGQSLREYYEQGRVS